MLSAFLFVCLSLFILTILLSLESILQTISPTGTTLPDFAKILILPETSADKVKVALSESISAIS